MKRIFVIAGMIVIAIFLGALVYQAVVSAGVDGLDDPGAQDAINGIAGVYGWSFAFFIAVAVIMGVYTMTTPSSKNVETFLLGIMFAGMAFGLWYTVEQFTTGTDTVLAPTEALAHLKEVDEATKAQEAAFKADPEAAAAAEQAQQEAMAAMSPEQLEQLRLLGSLATAGEASFNAVESESFGLMRISVVFTLLISGMAGYMGFHVWNSTKQDAQSV